MNKPDICPYCTKPIFLVHKTSMGDFDRLYHTNCAFDLLTEISESINNKRIPTDEKSI